jgi:DNA-binding response OmpR family regulator
MRPSHSKTVLVVDACPELQAYALEEAKSRGLSIITAPDPHVALTMLDMTVPDIILTDLFLPDMGGLALIKQVRAKYPLTALVLVAEEGNEVTIVEALRSGAIDYLRKPVHADELGMAFDRALHAIPRTVDDAPGIQQLEYRLVIGTDPSYVESCVTWLIQGTAMMFPETQRLHLRATLIELIVNAVEHGSLEITYQEKHEALTRDQYEGLIQERRRNPRFAQRRVIIRACYDKPARVLRYTITDEGNGFRWKSFLTSSEELCNSREANGRGVFLARSFFPDVRYNDRGNEVSFTVSLA